MSETNSTNIISIDDLFVKYAEWRNGHQKSIAIVRSTSGIASIIASSLLILTIFRSTKRLSTTFHRLLLGMSIGDILLSLSVSTFQASVPKDVSYMVWNAGGNQATCTVQGVLTTVGMATTLSYSCSLNLYYLAMVKHNKSETYIRTKIEPFLHGIPILIAFICGITALVYKNYNISGGGGTCCASPIYNPPHCKGYDEGTVREGFEIPCERGSNGKLYILGQLLLTFFPPIIMCVSLGMIYNSALRQERRIARYGRGALNPSAQQTSGGSFASLISSISSRFGRKESSNPHAGDGDNSNSRAVMNKALAYSIAYFLAWTGHIISFIMILDEVGLPVALQYIWAIMMPLQGLFNFLVYLHPQVMKAKKSPGQDLSWCQALGTAFWSGINGSKKKSNNPPVHVASSNKYSHHLDGDNKKNPPPADSDNTGDNVATDGATSLQTTHNRKFTDIEEEKTEIRPCDDWDDSNTLKSNETG